ncbi:MAG: YggS family pyridoxal phosphate-dependent enzyme [Bacteroidetes bacterium]|nr:YggS family pyridoxal phosphate-dependent enzyme [Bacteroidota bacterium]
MSICENLRKLKEQIPSKVRLIAVSKTQPVEIIKQAYECGQLDFGENKVQDLVAKASQLPADIRWHYLGHLQTNKVKALLPHVTLIQSVESLKLLFEINKESAKTGRVTDCLFQFHIAKEETKFGLNWLEAVALVHSMEYHRMKNVRIVGVMGMASLTEDMEQVKKEFHTLTRVFYDLKDQFFNNDPSFKELSMGMSGDYPIALEEGATMLRLGTIIFGERKYIKETDKD